VSTGYVIRPKADQDLEEQAYYYAIEANRELGHRFLVAAHEAFGMLAEQPEIGWHPRFRIPKLKDARVFRVSGFEKMLVVYKPHSSGVEILRVIHGSRMIQKHLKEE
jgi:plasmid stabilization system protein ParE